MFGTRNGQPPMVVGHRGAAGHAPENTMASFATAARMGVAMVECDVHMSADGVPVVIHDLSLERTTSGHGLVSDHTADSLRQLDAGQGQGVPLLDELLAWCRGRVGLSIEIKGAPVYHRGLADKVVELVRRHGMVEHTSVISFDHHAVKRVKELEPRIATGALIEARPIDGAAIARAAGADALMPHWRYATPDLVEQVHAAGLAVSVWTVNDRAALTTALAAGVDAIASDYPDRVLGWLASSD